MSKRGDEVSYFRATELLLYNYPHMHDDRLAQVVKAYAARREYPVIQMRYFGRGLDGEQLPAGKYYTWEQITDAMDARDLLHDERTARRWRSQIVSDMAVCIFGAPAALQLSKQGKVLPDSRPTDCMVAQAGR